jgi:hypothetical protein
MSEDTKTVEQIDAEIEKLTAARKAKLDASKQADLETVKKLCKQHGFTATQLRGCLVTRGKGAAEDGTAKKPRKAKSATN